MLKRRDAHLVGWLLRVDRFRSEFVGINLGQLQQWIDAGRLSPEGKITMATLQQSGLSSRLTKSYEKGIKLLAGGSEFFAAKLDLEVRTSLFHHLLSASGRHFRCERAHCRRRACHGDDGDGG